MLDYIVKVLLFQTLFLMIYDIVLKKETFFQWNRAYLLLTSVLVYVLPLIKIERVAKALPQEYTIFLPEVILSPQTVIEQQFNWSAFFFSSLRSIFWIGIAITTVLFLMKLFKVLKLIRENEKEKSNLYQLIYLENQSPFSFFNCIFLSKKLSKKSKQQIIAHELVHVRQRHSLDLLFFELQKIICWFNPFSYFYQQRIAELHEFIADAKSIKETEKTDYFQNLLNTTFGTHTISFINPFFKHSLIKKRIVMLNKNKSKQILKFKYLLLLPLLVGMLIYSSCEKEPVEVILKDKSVKELLSELSIKAEQGELTEEDSKSLIYILAKSSSSDGQVSDDKRKILENLLMYTIRSIEKDKIREVRENKKGSEIGSVPFAIIEQAPVFPGCENELDSKKCLQDKIREHFSNNFNTKLTKNLGLQTGKKRVYIQFIIDKNGKITEAKARGPHIILEEEAIRLVKELPRMQPSEQRGKKVAVKYTLPISIVVE